MQTPCSSLSDAVLQGGAKGKKKGPRHPRYSNWKNGILNKVLAADTASGSGSEKVRPGRVMLENIGLALF